MKVCSDDVRIEDVMWSSKENVYKVYFKSKKEMVDKEKVNILFEYVGVNGIRKEYRNNNDNMYVNTLLWKIKHQNYMNNINETLNIKLILNVNTTFNETAITSSIQHNNTAIITSNNINIKTIIITYNPIIFSSKEVIVYYTEFPFYFSFCSTRTLNLYVIIFTCLFLLCLIYIIHFIFSSILIDKLS